jgi:hypothetical protein
VVARVPAAGGSTVGLRPAFRVTFSEPVDVVSWLDVGLLVQDPAGTVIHGIYSWDAAHNTGTFVPAVPLIPGGTYVVTVGAVTDVAGNSTPNLGGWLVRALLGHDIALSAAPTVTSAPGATTLRGSTDPGVGGPLLLEESVANGPWGAVATIQQDVAGAFSLSVPLIGNTSFRVHFVGSDTEADTHSAVVRVAVRRAIRITLASAAVSATLPAGRSVRVIAELGPAAPDVPVTLTVLRYDAMSGRWRQLSTSSKNTRGGSAAFAWLPATAGTYRLRASTASTPLFANGFVVITRKVS